MAEASSMPVRQGHFSVRGTDLTMRNGVQNCNGGGFGSRHKMLKKSILSRHWQSCRLLPSYILAECLWHNVTTFHGDRDILNELVLWGIPTILATLNLRQPHLPVLLDPSIRLTFWRSTRSLLVDPTSCGRLVLPDQSGRARFVGPSGHRQNQRQAQLSRDHSILRSGTFSSLPRPSVNARSQNPCLE